MEELDILASRLQGELRKRIDELNVEISRYPGPIARCDEQLAGLLEERARLMRVAEALQELETSVA